MIFRFLIILRDIGNIGVQRTRVSSMFFYSYDFYFLMFKTALIVYEFENMFKELYRGIVYIDIVLNLKIHRYQINNLIN